MNSNIKKVMNNKNLHIEVGHVELYISLIPYDNDLEDIKYVKKEVERVFKNSKELKELYQVDNIVMNLGSYCIDGLTETNDLLVSSGSVLQNRYTDIFRTLRV